MGNAKTFRQVTQTTVKADLGEEGNRTSTISRSRSSGSKRRLRFGGKRPFRRVHHPATSLFCGSAYQSGHLHPIAAFSDLRATHTLTDDRTQISVCPLGTTMSAIDR
jgi:hypothetical protein